MKIRNPPLIVPACSLGNIEDVKQTYVWKRAITNEFNIQTRPGLQGLISVIEFSSLITIAHTGYLVLI